MPLTAQQVAEKWSRNLGQATESIRAGINSVTVSPPQKAAASADLWQQRVSAPETKAKFIRRAGAVDLQAWKQAALDKGVNRIASGAQTATPKMAAFMTQWLPFVNSVAERVRAMPKNNLEDRIARAVAQIRGNAAFNRGGM